MKKKFLVMFLVVSTLFNSGVVAYGDGKGNNNEVVKSGKEEKKNSDEFKDFEFIEMEVDNNQIKEINLKEKDFKYVKTNERVGILKDKKFATHQITNQGLDYHIGNENRMKVRNVILESSSYNKELYLIQEIFIPDNDGNMKYMSRGSINTEYITKGYIQFLNIPKELYKNNRYFYIRIGVADERDSNSFSDSIMYKIDNLAYEGYFDIENHYAEKIIMDFSEKGYIKGYKDKTFRPNNAITRAEFIKIVNKYFGYTNGKEIENFQDVDKKHWFYNEVNIALNAGYISGSNEKFRPNAPISREEVASIVTSIKNKKDNNLDKIEKLSDYSEISNWAKSSVEGAIEGGYMGQGGSSFRPKDNITRAEAVTTLSRIK